MKNILLIFALFVFFCSSCQQNENPRLACGVSNPAVNLTWLSEKIEELEASEFSRNYSYINQVAHEGQTLFVLASCCPNCNWAPVYYDCEGSVVVDDDLVFSELTGMKLVWKSASSTCKVGE